MMKIILHAKIGFVNKLPKFSREKMTKLHKHSVLFLCTFEKPLILSFYVLKSIRRFRSLKTMKKARSRG